MTEFNERLIRKAVRDKTLSYEDAMRVIYLEEASISLFTLVSDYLVDEFPVQVTECVDTIINNT